MVVVTRNKGLTVAEVTDLRRRMRAAGATFKVAKNRLATLALDGTRFDGIEPLLKGPTALAWSADPVAVAKTAVEFAKTNEKFVVIGGALGTQTLDAAGVQALAELPALDALRARLLGMISDPRDADRRRARRRRPDSSRGSSGPTPRRTRRTGGLSTALTQNAQLPSAGRRIRLAWNQTGSKLEDTRNG